MSAAARSILVYAVYLFIQGLGLLVVPNILLPVFGLPQANDVWVRVVGMTVLFFSLFYGLAARYEWRPFFVLSLFTRLSVPLIFAAFAATGLTSWNLVLLTPADVLFVAWTWLALRGEPVVARASVG